MGKRKSSKIVAKKTLKKVMSKVFDCPFCSHQGCIEVKMDKTNKVGLLSCRVCRCEYQSKINYLSSPVDVYCKWIDECHDKNKKQGKSADAEEKGSSQGTEKI